MKRECFTQHLANSWSDRDPIATDTLRCTIFRLSPSPSLQTLGASYPQGAHLEPKAGWTHRSRCRTRCSGTDRVPRLRYVLPQLTYIVLHLADFENLPLDA